MRIALAADHAGFEFKSRLIEELRRLGHDVADEGTDSPESCDYPDYGIPAARSVSGEAATIAAGGAPCTAAGKRGSAVAHKRPP